MKLQDLCLAQTSLAPEDIARLDSLARQLPMIADLTGTDIFIDCPTVSGGVVVVAHAKPSWRVGVYKEDVVGQEALCEKEPAVFEALRTNTQIRDIKAVTQEDRSVKQDVVPIQNAEGACIAVLIRETDVTDTLVQEKKYQQLSKSYESMDVSMRAQEQPEYDLRLREVHHRIKNNLQIVASILNLQARGCKEAHTREILRENVSRVLTIATIHDILTGQDMSQEIDCLSLMTRLKYGLQDFAPYGKSIQIKVDGDHMILSANTASSVALVVNELVTNALQHAFEGRDSGQVCIKMIAGHRINTIVVSDNGRGFSEDAYDKSRYGLKIVESTVSDRLHGHLRIGSSPAGTRVSFDFKNE